MRFLVPVRVVLTIIIPVGILACNQMSFQKTITKKNHMGLASELLSTRPDKSGPLKIVIRLPADPLGKVPKEQRVDQLTLILAQQKSLTEKLSSISNKINIIYKYQSILNALYIVVPEDLVNQIDPLIPEGSHVALATVFQRPDIKSQLATSAVPVDLKNHNSVKYIGADQLHLMDIKGQGLKIGVIDTGIDYTHAMLGGSGKVEDYKKINPSQQTDQYPNTKVIGGYDFVGTDYDSASPDFLLRIPKPDLNPLDESGHGSHVAGTIAGIGDGIQSYTGVAPEASLYALKVFGKEGSTDDAVVMAALDFAANPDGNIETDDALDVVNLSLGSPFGTPKLLYNEAIKNLNAMGTIIVASAGNSGDVSYITGAAAVNDDALSVAASIDDMDQNWHFGASSFQIPNQKELIAESAEATFTKPLLSFAELTGKLVYIGLAASVTSEQAELLKGNIALIDRGEITFVTKITNAMNAGAIAAVVINNTTGSPSTMGGGTDILAIPAIMISQDNGKIIKMSLEQNQVITANLKTENKIAKPELIDTLTDFSSRGPRSEDSIIKPEIAAPGANIISAKVGGGTDVVQMSGTSMASPHIAGLMALLKQKHRDLNPQELKSLVMINAKSIKDPMGVTYPVTLQGAGRVQALNAVYSGISIDPSSISLGRNEIELSKILIRTLKFKNLEERDINLTLESQLNANLKLISPQKITLKAHEELSVKVQIKITAPKEKGFTHELDGFIIFKDENQKIYSVPVLAMTLKISHLSAGKLKVQASSPNESTGSMINFEVKNTSLNPGPAYLFQLLGLDPLKDDKGIQHQGLSSACDLESVGYRTIKTSVNGQVKELLQMSLKLYNPLTTWNTCEFSVLIDENNDGIADQELAGANKENTDGLGKGMASLLLDANLARAIRLEYETKVSNKVEKPVLNFTTAIQEIMPVNQFNQSSLMIIQTPISSLKTIPGKKIRIKVSALNLELDTIETDDFLGKDWFELPLEAKAQSITDIPETIELQGNETQSLELTKGEGSASMVIYYPLNHGAMTSAGDNQSQLLEFVNDL